MLICIILPRNWQFRYAAGIVNSIFVVGFPVQYSKIILGVSESSAVMQIYGTKWRNSRLYLYRKSETTTEFFAHQAEKSQTRLSFSKKNKGFAQTSNLKGLTEEVMARSAVQEKSLLISHNFDHAS